MQEGPPMVLHIHRRQLRARWQRQHRPQALQVALCPDAVCTLCPGLRLNLLHRCL